MFFKKQLIIVFLVVSSLGMAQKSAIYTNDLQDYQKALTLYNNKQYKAAQSLFDDIKFNTNDVTIQSDCAYYIANCAVRLNQNNADDLITDFVDEYPEKNRKYSKLRTELKLVWQVDQLI